MKELIQLKEKIKNVDFTTYIMILLFIAGLICTGFIIENKDNKINEYKDALQSALNNESDEEKIVSIIKDADKSIMLNEKKKELAEEGIEEGKAIKSCQKQQLDRLVNGLEYNINYCDGNNLEQFKGLE